MPFSPNMQKKFEDLKAWVLEQIPSVRSTHNLYQGTNVFSGEALGAQVGDYYLDTNEKVLSVKTANGNWTTLGFLSRNNFVWITDSGPPGTGESASLNIGDYYLNHDDGHIWWYSWMTGHWEDMHRG